MPNSRIMKRVTSSSPSDSEEEGTGVKRPNPDRAKSGAATYLSSFRAEWSKEWPFITKGSTKHHYWCSICRVECSCAHQGRTDLERHVSSEAHVKKASDLRTNTKINSFFSSVPSVANMSALEAKVRRAEVKMTATMVKHNVPLAFAEHLSPLLKEMFPDSEISKGYASGKTKTTCILNRALKPHCLSELIEQMKCRPFSISIDGSNDTGRK